MLIGNKIVNIPRVTYHNWQAIRLSTLLNILKNIFFEIICKYNYLYTMH